MENKSSDLTDPAGKTPDQIEREMNETRQSLTEKVAALENSVVGTIQNATDTVSDTVEAVKGLMSSAPQAVSDTVRETTQKVTDSVKQALDVRAHVRSNPWASVGVAAGLGFVTGFLTGNVGRRSLGASYDTPLVPPAAGPAPHAAYAAAPREPGFFDGLLATAGRELRQIVEQALSTATASLKQSVSTEVPKLVETGVQSAVGAVGNMTAGHANGGTTRPAADDRVGHGPGPGYSARS